VKIRKRKMSKKKTTKKATKKKATKKKATKKKATKKKATKKKATKKSTAKKATKKKATKKKTTAKKVTRPKKVETVASKHEPVENKGVIPINLDMQLGSNEEYYLWKEKAEFAFAKASQTFELPKVFKKLNRKINANRVLKKVPFIKTISTEKEKSVIQEAVKFVILQSSYYDDETAETAKGVAQGVDVTQIREEFGFSIDPTKLESLLLASQENKVEDTSFEDNFVRIYKDIYS
jgi:hypothetical protein